MDAKTLCLGVLTLGEASGYEIRKQFEEGPFAHFHETSFGSIYPALGKLADEGLVTCQTQAQEGRPDKKVYRLTDAGLRTFRKNVAAMPAADRLRSDHLFMLFFAEHLAPDHLIEVIDDYLADFQTKVAAMKGDDMEDHRPARRFVHGFGLSIYKAAQDYMSQNRDAFLSELLAETKKKDGAP